MEVAVGMWITWSGSFSILDRILFLTSPEVRKEASIQYSNLKFSSKT
jgi:hypothetical protein